MLIELQQNGQDEYMGWEVKVCCRAHDIVNRLGELAKIMEKDLNDWRDTIRHQRNKFYHLNYFTTQQLLSLRYELGLFKESRADRPIKSEIMALLQSVSRDISPQNVKESLFEIIALFGEQAALDQSSEEYVKAIQNRMTHTCKAKSYNLPHRNMQFRKKSSERIKDIVVNDNIPEAILSIDELTDIQKIILANLNENYGFRTKLVLLAFDRCAKTENEEVIVEWCNENSKDFPYPDSEEETASTMSYDDDDHDSITSDSPSHTTMDCEGPSAPTTTDSLGKNQKINAKIHFRQLDKHHPTVMDLVEAGFDLEQSIKAASKYPDDPSAAIDYLDDSNIEEGATAEELFGESSSSGMTVVEPIVHSDGLEESVQQRKDSSMLTTSQTL